LRRITFREIIQIKKALAKRGYGWLNQFIGVKCESVGFCPEVKSCEYIKKVVKNYDEKFHQEMQNDLKKRWEENIKNLGKWS
jgi:hypothetical protein